MTTTAQRPELNSSTQRRYEIEKELGRGGMATVYLARDQQTNRHVALKVLLPDLAASIGAARFLREIALGEVLQHEHIVSVLDSGEIDGSLYYTMPYVDGESLRDRLTRQKQLTIDETLVLTRQIADALTYAHAKGIIHRDVKPENILLSGDRVWVADFGVARAVTVAGGETLTKTGMAVGTPTYMSPEQALGSKDITPASDIYSLGCVVYEMLAGQPPFAGANPMALLAKHSLESVPSLRVVRQSVSEELEDAIFCALEKTPADRFASAVDFARALSGEVPIPNHGRTRRGSGASRQSARAREATWTARWSRTITAVAAVVLVSIGAVVWRARAGPVAPSRIGTDSDPTHIAVTYFEDRSPQHSLAFAAEGLTEALIHQLSAVKQLTVISANGVAPFKDKAIGADSIGRALKVGTIISGRVSQAGNTLRVDVSLVDPLTNREIDNTRVDAPRDSVVALQDDLAARVAEALRVKLGAEVETLTGRAGTRDAKAWEAMERGKQVFADALALARDGKVDAAAREFAAADSAFARVEAIDAKWVAPTVQRGWVAYQESRLLAPNQREELARWLDQGMGHAARAMASAPNDADALELRGTLRYMRFLSNLETNPTASAALLDGAEKDLDASTAANPLQASAWNALSHLRMAKGLTSEARSAAQNAYASDPYLSDVDRTVWRLFLASLDLGDREQSRRWCDVGEHRFPANFRFTECRLWLFALEAPTPPTASEIWRAYKAYVAASPPQVRAFNAAKGDMMVSLGLIRAGMADSARRLAVATQSVVTPQLDPAGELIYLR
ncbi:MAG TPA: serine/threonine-protein kinase, partial [Gemmatimonadaceae bacterium]